MPFNRTQIGAYDRAGVLQAVPDHELMLATILRAIVERFERHADYPFIDTKLSMLTGEDFPEAADPTRDFKGRSAIFTWIQGRGLEALAGHARWLPSCSVLSAAEKNDLGARLLKMTGAVFERMELIRQRNNGRLSFLVTPEGQPFDMGLDGCRRNIHIHNAPYSFSDLFYVKGLLAAAVLLKREEKAAEAREYFRAILNALAEERFVSGQVYFDPKNRPVPVPGKFFHGPRMIALGGLALYAELLGDEEWFDWGERFTRHILDRHTEHGQWAELRRFDLCEAVDASGAPWRDSGKVIADPGHGCEFAGLAAKLLLALNARPKKTAAQERLLRDGRELFPGILIQSFRNGWNARTGGICKTVDLLTRQPVNSDLPWWNLPETVRTAAELLKLCTQCDTGALYEILALSSNAFFKNFVNPAISLMAYQTLNAGGQPVDVIPATADADPGYHTGLSLIDFLNCIRN